MKRPNLLDQDVINTVAKKLSPRVSTWLGENTDPSDDLAKAIDDALSWDGFRIALALSDLGWEPDEDLVHILSQAGSEAYAARDELTRQWVTSKGILPAHKVGDMVKYKGHIYEITKIDEKLARYLLFSETLGHVRSGLGTHGTYANSEDVEDHRAE